MLAARAPPPRPGLAAADALGEARKVLDEGLKLDPHNTAANCGYRTDRIYRDRNGVWRDRYGNRNNNFSVGFIFFSLL